MSCIEGSLPSVSANRRKKNNGPLGARFRCPGRFQEHIAMRLIPSFSVLIPCLALLACQSGPPPAQARLQDSHADVADGRVDTFRVTSTGLIGGPQPVDQPMKHLHDDNVYPIDAGRTIHVTIEGRINYTNTFKAMFGNPHAVTGRIDIVAPADASYVVRGEIGATESVVWLEDVATHAVVDRKFTATFPADVEPQRYAPGEHVPIGDR